MTSETIEEAYHILNKLIKNKKSVPGGIANELVRNFPVELEDLANDLIVVFMRRNHKPIKHIKTYVRMFAFREMMNIKRKYIMINEHGEDRKRGRKPGYAVSEETRAKISKTLREKKRLEDK